MATSGTVNQTLVSVATLIDTAFRRAGKSPSTVSGELLEAAQNSLFFLLSDFANDGVNLFCIRKNVFNARLRSPDYQLAPGTTDVLNVYWRELQDYANVAIGGPDNLGVQLMSADTIENVSGTFDTSGEIALVVEYDIGAGWKPLLTLDPVVISAGYDFAYDLPRSPVSSLWRVRNTLNNGVVPNTVHFRNCRNELNLAQLNRDDYLNLPDKHREGGKPLQYWFDKQIDPILYVWPTANNSTGQLVVYQHGLIEDVGKLTNSLAVPSRWYEAVIFTLAARLCLEIPAAELPPGRYETVQALAREHVQRAGRGESDGSSFMLQPQIRGYTR